MATASKRKGAKTQSAESTRAEQSVQAFRDALEKSVTISRDRLQETLDDAVRRGRMTRGDAEELLASLIAMGRRQTEELLSDLEGLVERSRGAAADAGRRVRDRTAQNTDRVRREVDRARRLTGLGTFP